MTGTKPYAARVGFDLAQVNVSRLLAPLDSPLLAEFMAALDEVNADGDAAPGFRWSVVLASEVLLAALSQVPAARGEAATGAAIGGALGGTFGIGYAIGEATS